VKLCHAAGLKIKALMSIGHAGESAETVESVRDWVLKVRPDDFDLTIISTYGGTPYFDEALPHPTLPNVWTYTAPKSGDRLHSLEIDHTQNEGGFYKGIPGSGYKAHVFTDYLTSEELVTMRDDVESDVRAKLAIPFNPGAPGARFEASMGQLPGNIFRRSAA
jgi:hypothetical protein